MPEPAIMALMSLEQQLRTATARLRSFGAVAVLGAGLSAPRYPMTADLRSLLWHALDSVVEARAELAADLGVEDGPAKALIDDNDSAVESGWQVVARNQQAREAFQHAFARLDAVREPTPGHYAVARLLRAGVIEYVISFNWDTALERAYEQLFGNTLIGRGDLLAKPHGDASAPEDDWTLPNEGGVVSQPVLDRMAALIAERPRVLLVVGYSGSDAAIVEQLLGPAEERWPVVRVGPNVMGPETINGFADDVMPVLADELNAPVDMVGWRWVGFTRSRDLSAALMGYRLGPQDVRACPVLPAARSVVERLRRARFVVLIGDSGAGKSITAFHAAYELHRDGWSVVELSQSGVATVDDVRTFASLSGRVLAVVDDAQALAPEVVEALERVTSDDHAVVLVATERAPSQELVRVSARRSVAVLAEYCATHRDVVEPLVMEIDDRVGDGMARESFDQRLKAAKPSDYPWQFMYVLGGGERRINGALSDLAERNGADLLLGMLAATQLLSIDAGVTRESLAEHAAALGRHEQWFDEAMAVLRQSRLIISRDAHLRSPHLRIADRALLVLCRDVENPCWRDLIAFLRTRLLDAAEALQGILWMLRAIDQADVLRNRNTDLLLDNEATQLLVDRCLAVPAGKERSIAAYLLWELGWWHALSGPVAERIAAIVPTWVSEATSDDVYGIRWLLSGFRSNFPDLHAFISTLVEPESVARRVAEHGSAASGESWGDLIVELARAPGIDTESWAARFEDALDTDLVVAWVQEANEDWSLRGPVEFVNDLIGLAPRTAAAVVAAIAPDLSAHLQRDPAATAHDLVPWAFGVFSLVSVEDDAFWQSHDDHRVLRDAILDWIDRTDWPTVGRRLTSAPLYEMYSLDLLLYSISQMAPDAFEQMATHVSLDELDGITEGHWRDLSGIEHLVVGLGQGKNHEPGRSWVHSHRDEILTFPTRVIPIAPSDAVAVLARGGEVVLAVQGGLRWGWCAEALEALLHVDRDAAQAVVEASRSAIVEGLALRQANMVEHLDEFISALDRTDPSLLTALLDELDPEEARRSWAERLAGSEKEAASARLLLDRALNANADLMVVARDLLAHTT